MKVFGEGFLPGLQMASLSSHGLSLANACPVGVGRLRCSSYKATSPLSLAYGFSQMTLFSPNYLLTARLQILIRVRDSAYEWGYTIQLIELIYFVVVEYFCSFKKKTLGV